MKKENIINTLLSFARLMAFPTYILCANLNKDYYGKAEIVWNSYILILTAFVVIYLLICVVPFCTVSLFVNNDKKTLNRLSIINAFLVSIFIVLIGEPGLAFVAYIIVRLSDAIIDKLKRKGVIVK